MARSLTKLKRSGEVYTRPPGVESNIDGALAQDDSIVRQRLQVTDRGSADYLLSECLVHLIRHFNRLDNPSMRDALVWVLLERCAAILVTGIDSGIPNAAQLREDILQEFAVLLASDGSGDSPNELDFYECRFNRAFEYFRIDMLRREERLRSRLTPLPSESADDEDQMSGPCHQAISCPATQLDGLCRDELINALPDDIRQAVVLVHVMGYEVESDDPEKPTAATLCGTSGRTIRKRLARAKELISQLNQEHV